MFIVIGVMGVPRRRLSGVPLAADIFVAETTGGPSLVVPGLAAGAAAKLMMSASSVTDYQINHGPLGHVIAGHQPA